MRDTFIVMVDKSNCMAKYCLSFQTVVIRIKLKLEKNNFKLNLVELLTLVLIGIELNFTLSYKTTILEMLLIL